MNAPDRIFLQLPVSNKEIRRVQQLQLIRFLLLSTDVSALQYYVGIALDSIRGAAPNTPVSSLRGLLALKHTENVTYLRFGLLIAMNASTTFSDWVRIHSPSDSQLVDVFFRKLSVHFDLLINGSNAHGEPALLSIDVVYPSVDHFVAGIIKLFVRLA
jgi:hypothetical protein